MNFLIKTFSSVILTISFLLLVYIFYKSEIFWNGNNRNYYKIYYLISSILIFFSIITFFINDKIKEYLIISGISLVVSLYLSEGYLTFKEKLLKEQLLRENPSKEQLLKEKLYEKKTHHKWDRRSKNEIYNDLKKTNNEIVVSVKPSHLIYDKFPIIPLSGISNSKTIFCNENGYYSIYQSDRYGFNNPDGEWDEHEIEYLLVGDSFTHGACVNRPNDISSILRNLSNKSVLNLGMSGNGPLIQYATLREYLDTNVKKVLWIYYKGNDLTDLTIEKKNNILINYIKDLNFTQDLKLKQNEIDDLEINFIKKAEEEKNEREIFRFEIIKFIKIFYTRYLILPSPNLEPNPAPNAVPIIELQKILQLTKELTNKNNSKLYFVYLTDYRNYKIKHDNTNYNLVKNIVTQLQIPFIDIHKEVFEKEENPLILFPFEQPGHYNVQGYKKVAETIYKFTKD
jgi:hypothetical protein